TEPADLCLVQNGDIIDRRPLSDETSVTIDPLAFASAGWCRAELYRRHTLEVLALTNPIYWTATGLR
ncbi:MAG: hypothetical protein ACRDJN_20710, partial [Chloroflexota bacterium]